MQITLTDEQYARLSRASSETGVSIAELIRRRIDESRTQYTLDQKLQAVRDTAGMWAPEHGAPESGSEYVERMRPGVAERLRRKGV